MGDLGLTSPSGKTEVQRAKKELFQDDSAPPRLDPSQKLAPLAPGKVTFVLLVSD